MSEGSETVEQRTAKTKGEPHDGITEANLGNAIQVGRVGRWQALSVRMSAVKRTNRISGMELTKFSHMKRKPHAGFIQGH